MTTETTTPTIITDTLNIDILKIFANDGRLIMYRPEWRKAAGSVTATILLSQILYRWERNGRRPFYKFKAPCEHELYRNGDSWLEELGFSKKEFEGAMKLIAEKRTSATRISNTKPVTYWTDTSRVTYYEINSMALTELLQGIYKPEGASNPVTALNPKRGFTKSPKGDLLNLNPKRGFTKIPKGDLEYNSKMNIQKTHPPPPPPSAVAQVESANLKNEEEEGFFQNSVPPSPPTENHDPDGIFSLWETVFGVKCPGNDKASQEKAAFMIEYDKIDTIRHPVGFWNKCNEIPRGWNAAQKTAAQKAKAAEELAIKKAKEAVKADEEARQAKDKVARQKILLASLTPDQDAELTRLAEQDILKSNDFVKKRYRVQKKAGETILIDTYKRGLVEEFLSRNPGLRLSAQSDLF